MKKSVVLKIKIKKRQIVDFWETIKENLQCGLIGGHYKAITFLDNIDYQVIENSQQVKNTESRNGID